MKESRLSKQVTRALKQAGFQCCRVENPCEPGFPDLAYQTPNGLIGLCELKQRTAPKRSSTKVDLGLRPAQRAFIATWGAGAVFTFAKVGDYYLLLADGRVQYPLNTLLAESLWWTHRTDELLTQFPWQLQKQSTRRYATAVKNGGCTT